MHAVLLGALAIAWFVFAAEDDGGGGLQNVGRGILVVGLGVAGLLHALVSTIALGFYAHRRHATLLVHATILLVILVAGALAFVAQTA